MGPRRLNPEPTPPYVIAGHSGGRAGTLRDESGKMFVRYNVFLYHLDDHAQTLTLRNLEVSDVRVQERQSDCHEKLGMF